MNNDVTIGIPMYNAEQFIERSISSALSQSYSYIDFLIIDDACTDSSVNIIYKLQTEHPRGKNISALHLLHFRLAHAGKELFLRRGGPWDPYPAGQAPAGCSPPRRT